MSSISVTLWKACLIIASLGCVAWLIWYRAVDLKLNAPRGLDKTVGIVATPAEVDFIYNEAVSKSGTVKISLHNRGSRNVNLLEIHASCGCTLPQELPSRLLNAGQQIQLSIHVNPPSFGLRNSLLTIRTDSAETPILKIPLRLHGQKLKTPYMSFAPSTIRVDAVFGDLPILKTFRVTCVESHSEPWLQSFKANSGDILLKQPKLVVETKLDDATLLRDYDTQFQIIALPTNEANQSFWFTPITRSEPTQSFSRINVSVSHVSAIRAAPSSLVMSFSNNPSAIISRQVLLIAADDSKWDVTSTESNAPWLTAQAVVQDSAASNRKVIISATKPDSGKTDLQQSDVRIRTNHPQCPEIVVRVTAVGS